MLYGKHLRLLLSTVSWHLSKTRKEEPEHAADCCLTCALELLHLIVEANPPELIYYVQDSFHVMTAFAATIVIMVSQDDDISLHTQEHKSFTK